MRLEAVDKTLGVVLIFMGLLQWLATPYFFLRIEEPAAWFFAGGMLLMLIGALNLLRIKYGAVAPGVKRVSVAANLVLSAFWLAMLVGLFYKFVRYPFAFIGISAILTCTIVSLLSPVRRSS